MRAFNVDDLATWLESAPWTTTWLAEQRREPIKGVYTAQQWWTRWIESTDNQVGRSVVLAGRHTQVTQLSEAVRGSRITTIGGDVRLDETRAFVAAVLADESASKHGIIEPILFVEDLHSATRLLERPGRLIVLVPHSEYVNNNAVDDDKHVIVHIPGCMSADIVLPPVSSRIVSERLKLQGCASRDADELGALARRSLLALRRHLATRSELHRPKWANQGAESLTRLVLLANCWNETISGDRDLVEQFVGRPYQDISDELRQQAADPDDPMVAIIDERWHVVAPSDAWQLLGRQLTSSDITTFGEVVQTVLLEPEPIQGLTGEARWDASLHGVTRRFSLDLVNGVANSLALLAISCDVVKVRSQTGSALANSIVSCLLQRACNDETCTTWSTLAPRLPILAEAAPTVVLDALKSSLNPGSSLTTKLYDKQDRYLFLNPPRTPLRHFLRTLEVLAWSPDHFHEAVRLLAHLAELDPDTGTESEDSDRSIASMSDKPIGSLLEIFLPLSPSTAASVRQQRNALDRICQDHPEVGWDLLVLMLVKDSLVLHDGPRYQGGRSDRSAITFGDYHQTTDHVAQHLSERVGSDPTRWKTLITVLPELPAKRRKQVVNDLRKLSFDGFALAEDRDSVWHTLHKLLRHRGYNNSTRAIAPEELVLLDEVLELLAPSCARVRHEWLFKSEIVVLDDTNPREDLPAHQAALRERRERSVREILDEEGTQGVVAFSETIPMPEMVGMTLARIIGSKVDIEIATLAGSKTANTVDLAVGFVCERFRACGWAWMDELIDEAKPRTTALTLARMLIATRDPMVAEGRADALGEEVAQQYWQQVSYVDFAQEHSQATRSSSRLVSVGRGLEAIALLAAGAQECDNYVELAEAAACAFEAVIEHQDNLRLDALDQSRIKHLLGVLVEHRDSVGIQRVTRIEWFFLSLLDPDTRSPLLIRRLFEDPDFFTEVVRTAFLFGERDNVPPSEQRSLESQRAYSLLQQANRPGVVKSEDMEPTILRDWVDKARHNFLKAGRESIGDNQIGRALAGAPADSDGLWPCQEVRVLLEDLSNDEINGGLQMAVFNRRGVSERLLDDGGQQEQDLAQQYRSRAERFTVEWPQTAAIFRGLALRYEGLGHEEETEAEAIRRGL